MFDSLPPDVRSKIEQAQRNAPVKVIRLAREFNLEVYEDNLGKYSGRLSKDAETKSGWSITVNSGEFDYRQRFTIAHELGHYFLHKDQVGDGVSDDAFYRSSLSNRLEAQANAFAADLLMPWSLINSLVKDGLRSPAELASKLKVSEIAMKIRLGIPT